MLEMITGRPQCLIPALRSKSAPALLCHLNQTAWVEGASKYLVPASCPVKKKKPSISSRSCVCICSPEKAFTLQSTLKNTQPKHSLSAKGDLPLYCKWLFPAGKCFVNKCICIKHVNPKEGAEWEMGQRWWPRLMDKHPAPGIVSPAHGKSSPGHVVAHTV